MYVASFVKKNLVWHASIINKKWSDEMFSYEASCIDKRKFMFLVSAKRWAKKQILNNMIDRKELEFING
jgi:hypothetical protein